MRILIRAQRSKIYPIVVGLLAAVSASAEIPCQPHLTNNRPATSDTLCFSFEFSGTIGIVNELYLGHAVT